jgi:hypothetical protein
MCHGDWPLTCVCSRLHCTSTLQASYEKRTTMLLR